MKPTLCSRCKKNVAVVFITRLDPNGQNSHNEGLCLKCARELNIRPVTDMIEKMGLSDEELEGLTNEMMSAFDGTESGTTTRTKKRAAPPPFPSSTASWAT